MVYIVCTSNLDLVSFLFVPALYSTMKLEIFPFIYVVTIVLCELYTQYLDCRSGCIAQSEGQPCPGVCVSIEQTLLCQILQFT